MPVRISRQRHPAPGIYRILHMKTKAVHWLSGLSCLLLLSCTESISPVDEALKTGELLWGNGTEIQGLDPHLVTGVPEHRVLIALCEGLTTYDPAGGKPRPGVAERWEISADGTRYLFHLRPDARWHNGDPVTAEDFVWSWQRLLTPALGAPFANMLYPVRNAERYHRGELEDFSQVGVRALDSHRLEVQLIAATPYFLSLLPHYSTYALHRPTLLQHGAMDDRNSPWTRPENFLCNGPFRLAEWEKNRHLRVVKTDTYWDAASVRLNAVRYLPVDKASTEERMFRAGQLHITSTLPLEQIPGWQGNPLMHLDSYLGTYFYRLNTTRPPLDDVRVRRALAMAIDKDTLVQTVTGAGERPAHSFTPPQPALGFEPDTQQPFDPEEARRLLAEAGYPGGKGMRQLELLYNTSEGHRKIAVAIQEMWRQHLGIQIQLHNQDWKVYLQKSQAMDYDISRAGWIADYEDPNSFLEIMVTDRGNNKTGWSDVQFDSLVARAARLKGEERIGTLLQAERTLISGQPVIPIYFYTNKYLLHSDVRGWQANVLDTHLPKYLYLQRD